MATSFRTPAIYALVILFFTSCGFGGGSGSGPNLDIAVGGSTFTLKQRQSILLPTSEGEVTLSIGDITRGKVEVTISSEEGQAFNRFMAEFEEADFNLGGGHFKIKVSKMVNALIGTDYADITITSLADRTEAEQVQANSRIDYLIKLVEESNATFIRNGNRHTAKNAANHLRRKWKKAGDITYEQFVKEIASHSSTTGKDYVIQLEDGTGMTMAEWIAAQDVP